MYVGMTMSLCRNVGSEPVRTVAVSPLAMGSEQTEIIPCIQLVLPFVAFWYPMESRMAWSKMRTGMSVLGTLSAIAVFRRSMAGAKNC